MIKKVKQCVALLPLLLLLGCPSFELIDIEKGRLQPIDLKETTNFLSSYTNKKIYAFDSATDEIVEVYTLTHPYVTNCIRLPNSPYLYFADYYDLHFNASSYDIYRVKIETGEVVKISGVANNLRQYSSTEILLTCDDMSSAKLDNNGKITKLNGKFTDGFTFKGKDYLMTDGILQKVTDGKLIKVSDKDTISDLSSDSNYEYRTTEIRKDLVTVRYSDNNTSFYDPEKDKVAIFLYSSLDTDIKLADCTYIGDVPAQNNFTQYIDGNLYGISGGTIHKYEPATKVSTELKLDGGEFISGIALGDSLFIGSSLYASLGLFEKTTQDMIVKVDLTNLTYKIISK